MRRLDPCELRGCAESALLSCAPPRSRGELRRRPGVVRRPPDLDLARLGPLRDRHHETQYAVGVPRLDVVEVEVVAEDELTTEHALGPLGGERLPVTVACDA